MDKLTEFLAGLQKKTISLFSNSAKMRLERPPTPPALKDKAAQKPRTGQTENSKIPHSGPTQEPESLKIGYTVDQSEEIRGLYLSPDDRGTHLYVIGSSGVGKSKGLANWILEDIDARRGCGVIDPHGDLIRDIVSYLPNFDKTILVDFTDPDYIIGFNPLEQQEGIDPFTQTLELVEVFRKIWDLSESGTPRLLEILRNAVLTLIEAGGTMLDIEPLLTNSDFRQEMIKYVTNEAVASFWHNRFEKWPDNERIHSIESTLNKVSTFTSDPRMRLMLSCKKSTIDFREIMDSGKTILINLSKGVLRTNSFLLGALFVAKVQMAAMSRQNLQASERRLFYFYVDEFQNYSTFSFAEILSEARKYGLSLTLAHQSLEQLDEKLRSIILGNAKNFVVFRPDRKDAELLIKYMMDYLPFDVKSVNLEGDDSYFGISEQWEMGISDLINLPARQAYLKTKGCEPTIFATYDLPELDNEAYELNKGIIRDLNFHEGYTKSLKDLDEDLAFQPASLREPDEPENFKE